LYSLVHERYSREERYFPLTLLIRFNGKIWAKNFFLHGINLFSFCVLINVIWQLCMSFHQQLEITHVRNLYYRLAGYSPCPLMRIVWSDEYELFNFY